MEKLPSQFQIGQKISIVIDEARLNGEISSVNFVYDEIFYGVDVSYGDNNTTRLQRVQGKFIWPLEG